MQWAAGGAGRAQREGQSQDSDFEIFHRASGIRRRNRGGWKEKGRTAGRRGQLQGAAEHFLGSLPQGQCRQRMCH